jgi:hypothetical protein
MTRTANVKTVRALRRRHRVLKRLAKVLDAKIARGERQVKALVQKLYATLDKAGALEKRIDEEETR